MAKQAGRDYIPRSERRSGYRSDGYRQAGGWETARLVLSCLGCILCFPLGLIGLWTCRTGAGTKLLCTVVTGFLFFALCAFALTVETSSPLYTRIQDRCIEGLSTVEERMAQDMALSQRLVKQTSALAKELLPPVLQKAQEGLDAYQRYTQQAREQGLALLSSVQRAAVNALYTAGVIETPMEALPVSTPSPSPIPVQTTVPTAVPTSAPETTPTPSPAPTAPLQETPAPDKDAIVYWKPDTSVYHTTKDCPEAADALIPKPLFFVSARNIQPCPACCP